MSPSRAAFTPMIGEPFERFKIVMEHRGVGIITYWN